MKEKFIIAMIGHTAAGKTTLAKYLSERLNSPCISEGKLKRSLKTQYISENSLDEELRDKGYKMAIMHCIEQLSLNDIVIIDASFHRLIRRIWLYDAITSQLGISVIWLYCDCPNENEVKNRLYKRASEKEKNADNQADQFYIYEYIKSTFDPVSVDDFNPRINTAIIKINTAANIITGIEKNTYCSNLLLDTLIDSIIPTYLQMKKLQSFGGVYG